MLRYPNGSDIDNMCPIALSDIIRLRPHQETPSDMFLSDATADFCISYMQQNISNPRKDIFITHSLFYEHLKALSNNNDSFVTAWYIGTGKLKGISILVVPIVSEIHFTTMVITDIWGTPLFFHYDSLVDYHSTDDMVKVFAEYLKELKRSHSNDDQSSNTTISVNSSNVVKINGPIQENRHDCGIFSLKFIQNLLGTKEDVRLDLYLLNSFSDSAWSSSDVLNYRNSMYDIGMSLYDDFMGNQNIIATQNIVRAIEENRYSIKHKEPKPAPNPSNTIDSYILDKFGTMDSYIRVVPSANDQEYIRQCYNQKLHLCDTFNSRKRSINCGYYRGEFVILSKYQFHMALSWAPSHVSCWDNLPIDYDRYPKTYGHINFAALEGPNRQIFIASSPLQSKSEGCRYILWLCHLTTCWKPIKEWTLFDTHTERFIVVKGINEHHQIQF